MSITVELSYILLPGDYTLRDILSPLDSSSPPRYVYPFTGLTPAEHISVRQVKWPTRA